MLNVKGHILNIQHFCTSDGPGIRTTVFLKGCPLHCAWCHNPETHNNGSELLFRAEKCSACGACVTACPKGAHQITEEGIHRFDRSLCESCGKCTEHCYTAALELAGKIMAVEEVLKDLLSDRVFYKTSNGGITLSGGEPTAQPNFTEALLTEAHKEGLHTALETAGVCSKDTLLRLLPHTDLFLLDWKISDDALHKKYTGVSNSAVLDTLATLDAHGKDVHLRCPLIPDVNTSEDHYNGIASLAARYTAIKQITLEPYHPLGIGKAEALGKKAPYQNRDFMDKNAVEDALAYIQQRASIPVVLGNE